MDTCEDILRHKGNDIFTIEATATVLEAVEAMCARHIGALLVSTNGVPRGIITERDVMTRTVLRRLPAETTLVETVMSPDVVCVDTRATAVEAMAIMTKKRCRHLPVVVDGRVVGMLSLGDLARCASREQQVEIKLLSEYIHGPS